MTFPGTLRILSLEDDPHDASLIEGLFEGEGISCTFDRVDTEKGFRDALGANRFDLILADHTLPEFDGMSALKIARETHPDIPFLFVSGTLGEEVAIEALKLGAIDYVLKTRLSRLIPSVHRALREARETLERKRAEEALRRSETYLNESQRLTQTGTWVLYPYEPDRIYWTEEHFRIFGYDPATDKASSHAAFSRIHPEDAEILGALIQGAVADKRDVEATFRVLLPGGTLKHVHGLAHPVLDPSGSVIELIGTSRDITEQHNTNLTLENAFAEIRKLKDQLYNENVALRQEIVQVAMFEEIIGQSTSLQKVLAKISKVSPTDSTVLVLGETGTGKELVARAIHRLSRRAERPFVSVNCAAIPTSLIASELFGHEKGAFTGATQRRIGRFELAEGGTLFLDEIGELPSETQIVLLRILQEREFERVGGTRLIKTNVRIIAATNRDLRKSIEAGTFREDLFYRLNIFPIDLPPLRERKEDIPLLVEYFVRKLAAKFGKKISGVHRASLVMLQDFPWRGNIRELQNIIERAVIVCDEENLTIDESWLSPGCKEMPLRSISPLRMSASQEREAIQAALTEAHGRISGPAGAAAKLGIPPSTLDSKIKSFGIDKRQFD